MIPRMSRAWRDGLLRLQILVLGVALWAFTLVLPYLHVSAPTTAGGLGLVERPLLFLPLAALLLGLVRGRAAWLLAGVPLSALPAILRDPALVGERVYGFPAVLVTAGVLAAWVALTARLDAPAGGVGRLARGSSAARPRLFGHAGVAALVVALALLVWWAGFDPATVWDGGAQADTAATRPLGRTVPVVVAVVCWVLVVSAFVTPLAVDALARRRGDAGKFPSAGEVPTR